MRAGLLPPPSAPALSTAALTEIRAALAAGAAPGAALLAAVEHTGGPAAPGSLSAVVHALRAGTPLAEAAERIDTGDPAADLLVRALGVAERTGAGSLAAVDQAAAAARDEADLARMLRARTLQARGTALVLSALPILAWVLLVAVDRTALAFYATPLGAAAGIAAVACAAGGHCWSRRVVRGAAAAAACADPLVPARAPRDHGRVLAVGVPALVAGGVAGGPLAGLLGAGVAVAVLSRRPSRSGGDPPRGDAPPTVRGGAAETVELLAVALASGLPAPAAVAAIGPLAPPAAREPLAVAARRLRGGWGVDESFAGGGLALLGSALAATERWGSPAEPALRRLGSDLRAERRTAAEEAAERAQLSLVFPTTLLTLPAFVLGVVPPLLWTALAAGT